MESKPSTAMVRQAGIRTHRPGCIVVDEQMQTNLEGAYAVGSCASRSTQTTYSCVDEGTGAGIAASSCKQLKEKYGT